MTSLVITTPVAFLVVFVLVQKWEQSRLEHLRKQAERDHREAQEQVAQ